MFAAIELITIQLELPNSPLLIVFMASLGFILALRAWKFLKSLIPFA